ncbi:MAG TPA: hypothetical protein VMS31_14750 [Pyrinomonadaceae bacterium]|nr:hypothetical protein [Pyrinomonadaceae bacterium]
MAKSKKTTKAKPRKSATKAKSRGAQAKPKSAKAAAAKKPVKPAKKTPNAMRLTFSYSGDQVKLVSQRPVEMSVPPSDPVKGYGRQKGFWAELKNEDNRTLYRRIMHNPTRNDAEVFSDDPEEGISRAPAPKRKGVFVVVVPNTAQGQEVTLCRSSGPPAGGRALTGPESTVRSLAAGPAQEIARFKLKK